MCLPGFGCLGAEALNKTGEMSGFTFISPRGRILLLQFFNTLFFKA
ncbi:hypothetical protein EVA_08696 [gut metagenome]|uniref:Uncharacterized protein n=1 Tax=gut metagenome TaxID=749906 RepID=J9G8L0_9ZZZZ